MTSTQPTGIGIRAVEAVRNALPIGASITTEGARQDGANRLRITDVVVNGHGLEVKWIGDGRLHEARQLLTIASEYDQLIAVARHMSPGARALLAEHGIGWVDETGAAEIAIGSIVVSRTGQAPKAAEPRVRWTRSVLAVAEALLCGSAATVSAMQSATGLSAGTSTNALRTLSELGLLESDTERGPTSGRRVADPDALLDVYSAAANESPQRVEVVLGALWRDPIEGVSGIGERWDAHGIEWAASGTLAGAVLAPLLTSVESALVYVDTSTMVGLEAVARAAGLAPIEGGRLTLRPFPTVTTQRGASQANGLRCAPWPRVYADLLQTGVRGEEAAEHLREVIADGR